MLCQHFLCLSAVKEGPGSSYLLLLIAVADTDGLEGFMYGLDLLFHNRAR